MLRGAVLILAAVTAAAQAQEPVSQPGPRLSVEARFDSNGTLTAPLVSGTGLLDGEVFDAALRSGFPVQLNFRLELYRAARLFDRLERSAAWGAVVRRDPFDNHYDLLRTGSGVERLEDTDALLRALEIPYTVDLLPQRRTGSARYYYTVQLEIESLSLTELEEIERWLRGELEPAVREGGDVGNALGRGARRLLIRFSGLPRSRLEARSRTFTW